MDFLFDNNTSIVEGSLGIDPVTGLEIKVQYTNINIDSRTKTITIYWDEVLVSPQNQVVSIRTNGCFDPVTGLEIKVQYTNINIDSRTKTITIYWDEVLVSPQNQVVSIRTNGC